MKRLLLIMVAILAAFTLTGLFVVLAKAGPLPPKVKGLDWRKSVKSEIADHVEAPAEELPA